MHINFKWHFQRRKYLTLFIFRHPSHDCLLIHILISAVFTFIFFNRMRKKVLKIHLFKKMLFSHLVFPSVFAIGMCVHKVASWKGRKFLWYAYIFVHILSLYLTWGMHINERKRILYTSYKKFIQIYFNRMRKKSE